MQPEGPYLVALVVLALTRTDSYLARIEQGCPRKSEGSWLVYVADQRARRCPTVLGERYRLDYCRLIHLFAQRASGNRTVISPQLRQNWYLCLLVHCFPPEQYRCASETSLCFPSLELPEGAPA